MTATVINLATASLRLRIKRAAKSKAQMDHGPFSDAGSDPRELRSADTDMELEAEQDEFDQPDCALYIGPAGEWANCSGEGCYVEIAPNTTVAQDLVTGAFKCVRCFHRGK